MKTSNLQGCANELQYNARWNISQNYWSCMETGTGLDDIIPLLDELFPGVSRAKEFTAQLATDHLCPRRTCLPSKEDLHVYIQILSEKAQSPMAKDCTSRLVTSLRPTSQMDIRVVRLQCIFPRDAEAAEHTFHLKSWKRVVRESLGAHSTTLLASSSSESSPAAMENSSRWLFQREVYQDATFFL
jgi:hypothetical protein